MDYILIYKVNFKVLQIHTSCLGTSGFFTWNLPQLAIDELLDYVGRMRAIGIQSRKAGGRVGGWNRRLRSPKGVCSVVIIWVCLKIVYPYTQWLMIRFPY